MALYMGFLLGSHVFEMKHFTIEKSILAWGRQQVQRTGQSTESKYRRVHSLFSNVCDVLQCRAEGRESLEDSKEKDEWDIRLCEMPTIQSKSYTQACSDLRSVLARSVPMVNGSDEARRIAYAFVQLRRHVFHSDIQSACKQLRRLSLHRATCSQPDIMNARLLMGRSGKLRQLIHMLVQEFGCQLTGVNGDVRLLFGEHRKCRLKPTVEGVSRLVILSSLPESQAIISGLLSLLGIEHDALSQDNGSSMYVHSQVLLAKFNQTELREREDIKIVVASPLAVSGDHCGLSTDTADAVLLVDEDWSGAEVLILDALAARCRFRRKVLGLEARRFIRLVAKYT